MRRYAPRSKIRNKAIDSQLTLDAFVSQLYLPSIKIRKRSWQIDERIGRQHLSPAFGHRLLSAIDRCEVEDWLNGPQGRLENVNLEQRLLHWALVQIRQAKTYRPFRCCNSRHLNCFGLLP